MTFALRVHLYPSVHKGDVLKLGNQVEVSEEGRLDLRAQRLQIRIRGFGAVRLDARADRQPKRGVELRDAARSRGVCTRISGYSPRQVGQSRGEKTFWPAVVWAAFRVATACSRKWARISI